MLGQPWSSKFHPQQIIRCAPCRSQVEMVGPDTISQTHARKSRITISGKISQLLCKLSTIPNTNDSICLFHLEKLEMAVSEDNKRLLFNSRHQIKTICSMFQNQNKTSTSFIQERLNSSTNDTNKLKVSETQNVVWLCKSN